jgi:hypothetical protein
LDALCDQVAAEIKVDDAILDGEVIVAARLESLEPLPQSTATVFRRSGWAHAQFRWSIGITRALGVNLGCSFINDPRVASRIISPVNQHVRMKPRQISNRIVISNS